jgi:GNAT superfamily N-acetyltransferase
VKYIVTATGHESGATHVRISNPRDTAYAELYVGNTVAIGKVIAEDYSLFHVEEALEAHAPDDTVAWFSWIRVNETSRHRGVGGRLLDAAVAWVFEETPAKAMYAVTVAVANDQDPYELQDWYYRHGAEALAPESGNESAEIVWYRP